GLADVCCPDSHECPGRAARRISRPGLPADSPGCPAARDAASAGQQGHQLAGHGEPAGPGTGRPSRPGRSQPGPGPDRTLPQQPVHAGGWAEHFFKDNGQYPARLAELVPRYLNAIPLEPCTNASYVYRPISRPRLDYSLSTGGYPATSECSRVAAGLSFAPALGLVNQP